MKTSLFLSLVLIAVSVVAQAKVQPNTKDQVAYFTFIRVKPGHEAQFIKEVHGIVAASKARPGNFAWFVQQSSSDATEFIFYTRWVNQAAIDYHLKHEPLVSYIERTKSFMAEAPRLEKFKPIDNL